MLNSSSQKGQGTKVSPLVHHIIVPNMDQFTSFAACQGMLDHHLLPTPITVVGHVLGYVIVPQTDIVPPFLCGEAGPVQTIWDYC